MLNGKVEFFDIEKTINGEDNYLYISDTYIQKHKYQTGLETLVVYAVTYGC